jgi:tRNA-specific 2-thiouridylase
MEKKALIAMSGGVDSSVAALLMTESGYECVGVTMRLFSNEDVGAASDRSCCSLDDAEDARQVARGLGMPFYVFDFASAFRKEVIDRFIFSYETGVTPNPCIDCNRYIKYETLFQRAKAMGFGVLATGHYARIEKDSRRGRFLLRKAVYEEKDQSYVLYSLTQEQLARTIFPLGSLAKPEVRKIAQEKGFINAEKHESQDICFVREGKYSDFIEAYTGKSYEPGNFVDEKGNVIGRHEGIIRYTIGQRKGLGRAFGKPMYVKAINTEANEVVLASNEGLFEREVVATDVNLISLETIDLPIRVAAKIRYNGPAKPCTAEQLANGDLHVMFDEPQRAVTKGQALVLYDGDVVVGGGTICSGD